MTRKFRKQVRYRRAQRTQGYGRIGGHRKKGVKGGHGLTSGKFKHMWSYYQKQKVLGFPTKAFGGGYNPWIIGKHGFKRPVSLLRINAVNSINLDDLQNQLDQLVEVQKATVKNKVYTVDLAVLGYNKLLGRGTVTKKMKISVEKASEKALTKVQEAGGSVEVAATAEE